MNKLTYRITLIAITMAVLLSSCLIRVDRGGGVDKTATYGAEQFHIQLTAQAREK